MSLSSLVIKAVLKILFHTELQSKAKPFWEAHCVHRDIDCNNNNCLVCWFVCTLENFISAMLFPDA